MVLIQAQGKPFAPHAPRGIIVKMAKKNLVKQNLQIVTFVTIQAAFHAKPVTKLKTENAF